MKTNQINKVQTQKHQPITKETAEHVPVASPAENAPLVPTGFVPPQGRPRLGVLSRTQIASAKQLATDLANGDASDFGPAAPSLTNLAALLEAASDWSTERAHAEAWRVYARAQEVDAWRPALAELDALKAAYQLRVKRDPSFAERYPSLALFFALGSARSKRGSVTRRQTPKPGASSASSAPQASQPGTSPAQAGSAPTNQGNG